MKKAYSYHTKLGVIQIAENGKSGDQAAITNVYFGAMAHPGEYEEAETPLIKEAVKQLNQYIEGNRKVFDLPYEMTGTEFERSVWNALLEIPFGETRSYGQVAASLGNPAACRAVGRANSRNPIGIFVPCHRVIGANGTLTGYAGGLEMKKNLLEIEHIILD